MIRSVMVTADVPHGVTIEQWMIYIQEWVACGKGSYPPEDPLFDLDGKTVSVRRMPRSTRKK